MLDREGPESSDTPAFLPSAGMWFAGAGVVRGTGVATA
jgi:hypothetical protein